MPRPAARRPALKGPGRSFAGTPLKCRPVSGDWLRLHPVAYGPIFFSKAGNSRWDAPDGPVGAMCVGQSLAGIVLERFGDQLRDGGKFLTAHEISAFNVTQITVDPPIEVADIRGPELFQLGIDSQLFAGLYSVSQRWSKAFMRHPQRPQGLLYNSRHDPVRTNLVMFDRDVQPCLKVGAAWLLKDHPDFTGMLRELRIAITPPSVAPAPRGP